MKDKNHWLFYNLYWLLKHEFDSNIIRFLFCTNYRRLKYWKFSTSYFLFYLWFLLCIDLNFVTVFIRMIEFVFVVFWVVFRYSRVAYSGFIYKYRLTMNNHISERTTAASLDTLMRTIKDGLIFIPQLYINT